MITDKGFDLICEVAAKLPDIEFVVIDSQPSATACRHDLAAGLTNVEIIPRTPDIARLYQTARVVVVPSYRFVETFSRVCIEAQKFGVPVIGSNVGNVPYLLKDSGIILEDDSNKWAEELRRLFRDETYYARRRQAALANARLFSQSAQRLEIKGLISTLRSPILVAIGSGVGNMLHCGPMIRNISRRTGQKVDLVVAADYSGSLFLLHDPKHVNSVYSLRQLLLKRRYKTIFLTHSFGGIEPPFNGGTISSRNWDNFRPDHHLHETLFNLEAAKHLLGVPYDTSDDCDYYVGDFSYTWPRGSLVGFHGGSKEGYWKSKRWPWFAELAELLIERGYRVASFGTPDEYVSGTENFTGGSLKQMVHQMHNCSYFVSNDSGVMNIANALGIPLIAIFGPTNVATRGPRCSTSIALNLDKSCAPCECKDPAMFQSEKCECIGEIDPQSVLNAFDQLENRAVSVYGGGEGIDVRHSSAEAEIGFGPSTCFSGGAG